MGSDGGGAEEIVKMWCYDVFKTVGLAENTTSKVR
jgi:hypothetical protein